MKRMKKLASMLLVMVMVLCLAAPAFAATDDNTLTITSKTDGHSYEAYQIFDGVYDGVGDQLTKIVWGNGVGDSTALLAALQANGNFTGCATAAAVAEKLATLTDDSDALDAFANIVAQYLGTAEASVATSVKNGETGLFEYKMDNLDDGYYFVKETTESNPSDAYSKFMLRVVSDNIVAAKADIPTIDKNIVLGEGNTSKTSNASIGDSVPFVLTSKVPAMDGYEKYFFIVNDTLSKGLTFNDDVVITIDKTTLAKGTDYTVTAVAELDDEDVPTGRTIVEIVFINFIEKKPDAGKAITITYSATLNENAVIGVAGNPNDVDMIYSNNPNVEQESEPGDDGNPDKPDPTFPVGKTPDSSTRTYVTGIDLEKVDDYNNPLTGATFTISGTKVNKTIVTKEEFVKYVEGDEDGYDYWELVDGTFTSTAPTISVEASEGVDEVIGNEAVYKSITDKYKCVKSTETQTKAEGVTVTAKVDHNGLLSFYGLAEGVYTITEIKAPAGYNLLKTPIYVKISWETPAEGETNCTWTAKLVKDATGTDFDDYGANQSVYNLDATSGIVQMEVVNNQGAVLPETGGIGTTMFYIIGAGLVLCAIVLLVVKKRMSMDSEK